MGGSSLRFIGVSISSREGPGDGLVPMRKVGPHLGYHLDRLDFIAWPVALGRCDLLASVIEHLGLYDILQINIMDNYYVEE